MLSADFMGNPLPLGLTLLVVIIAMEFIEIIL
jgi:hypothetical protein